MNRFIAAGVAFLLSVFGSSLAQECINYVTVDKEILEGSGFNGQAACYFIAQGNSSDAYTEARLLANALGLDLRFDDENKMLVFSDGMTTARLATTGDIVGGLERRDDVFTVNGQVLRRPLPQGILVDGISYVPYTPIVEAFGGEILWNAGASLLQIRTAAALSTAQASNLRVAFHDTFSRVALDLPENTSYEVSVGSDKLLVTIGARGSAATYNAYDPFIESVVLSGQNEGLALVIDTRYPLGNGKGYRVGLLPGSSDTDVLYIDLGPNQQMKASAVRSALAKAPSLHRTVVIDAGHGGQDGGTSHYSTEKDVVLAIALKLAAYLEQQGIDVVLSRDNDTFISLNERAALATSDRNLFISIHANAAPNRNASGIETYVFGQPLNDDLIDLAIKENGGGELGLSLTREALEVASLAGNFLREEQLRYSRNLAELVQTNMVQTTGAEDRGVKQNALFVIRNARIPAILVEVGFASHPVEGPKLDTASYQDLLARAMADGITAFFEQGGSLAKQ